MDTDSDQKGVIQMAAKNEPISVWKTPEGGSYPLEDASSGLFATITSDDLSCAVEGDPCRCVIAQAFKRAAGSPEVLIGRTIAYVVLKIDGEEKAMRFRVPAKTRKVIDSFDATGDISVEALELKPVMSSDKLESKRADDKRMRQRWAVEGHERKPASVDLSHRNSRNLATTTVVRRTS